MKRRSIIKFLLLAISMSIVPFIFLLTHHQRRQPRRYVSAFRNDTKTTIFTETIRSTNPPRPFESYSTKHYIRLSPSLFIYSCIVDVRVGDRDGTNNIRLLALASYRPTVYCHFQQENNVTTTNVQSSRQTYEVHAATFDAWIVSCPIPTHIDPHSIQHMHVSNEMKNATRIKLSIDYVIDDDDNWKYRYSICVPMLRGSRYIAEHIVEFMEWSKLFGVDQVFVYVNRSELTDTMKRAIGYYVIKRFVYYISSN